MSVTTEVRALIVTEYGQRVWKCPNCRKMIGELLGERLVVIPSGRRLTFPLMMGMTRTCPECGCESAYLCDRS